MAIADQCPGLFDFANNSAQAMISSPEIGPICDTLMLQMDVTTEAVDTQYNDVDNVTRNQVDSRFLLHLIATCP